MLIRNGTVFLQGYEVSNILFFTPSLPRNVLDELVKNHGRKILLGDLGYPYGFNFYLKEEANTEWVKERTWTIDYGSCANDVQTLKHKHRAVLGRIKELTCGRSANKTSAAKDEELAESIMQSRSLRALIDCCEGKIQFILQEVEA